MADLAHSESKTEDFYTRVGKLKWSPEEKSIARKAFNLALDRELDPIMGKARKMATKIKEQSDLWDLEVYLTQRRKEIDRKYDFRYSVLPQVFGTLIREGHLSEKDLHGLRDDKLECIRSWAKFSV